ncbi:FHIPEP family type III secretion protein [Bradyrhizobium sp. USDA 3256]
MPLTYILTPEVEDTVRNAIRQTSAGSYLALDVRTTRQINDKVREVSGNLDQQPHKPVLLTSMDIRRYVRMIIEAEFHGIPVLSYQELPPRFPYRHWEGYRCYEERGKRAGYSDRCSDQTRLARAIGSQPGC